MWNRIAALMALVITTSLLLTSMEVEARGGRGGGGRAGGARSSLSRGGAYRGGYSMNRTPTMSRASNISRTSSMSSASSISRGASRSAASQVRYSPQTRSSVSQGRQQTRQAYQQRSSAASRTDLRNQINQYAQSRQTPTINRQVLAQKTQNFSNNRSNQSIQNRQLSEKVSQRLQHSRRNYDHWFDRDFFDRHNIDVGYVNVGNNWWRPAAWATLATWGGWNWATPYYYDEGGYTYPITTSVESTYTYPYSTTTTTSQIIETPIQTQPIQSTQNVATTGEDWLPLGVFAVASNANATAYTNRFIQLAINRSGEIAGVFYNSSTDATQDLTGMVDPNTQKAYWSMTNRPNSPIASTGIYNLTEDQTPVNVHFSDGSDQTWTLVRLQQGQ